MKKFLEDLSGWIWVVMLLVLVFLFYGSPSVWDRLHDKAIGACPAPTAHA